MKKRQTALLYDKWIEEIVFYYGAADAKKKIEYVKSFISENFKIDEFEDSYIEIERLHSKSLIWLLLSLIIEYESMNQNLKEPHGLGDSSSQKIRMLEIMRMQEKFKSLEVKDIFLVEELTPESVEFIEKFLGKTNVNLESEDNFFFITTTSQMFYLVRKILQEYKTFLSNRKKFETQ